MVNDRKAMVCSKCIKYRARASFPKNQIFEKYWPHHTEKLDKMFENLLIIFPVFPIDGDIKEILEVHLLVFD